MTNHMFLFNPCFSVVNEGTSSLLNVGNNSPHYSAPYLWSPEFILIKFVEQELILWMAQKSLDLCLFFSILVIDLFVNVFFYFFCFIFFSFLIFCCCWGGLGYIFGCDLISYVLILLSLWIAVLIKWLENLFSVLDIFLAVLFLLLLLLQLCCIVLLEELVYSHFIFFLRVD